MSQNRVAVVVETNLTTISNADKKFNPKCHLFLGILHYIHETAKIGHEKKVA